MRRRFHVLVGLLIAVAALGGASRAALGGVALAAAPPSAQTGGTSSVSDTSATLHGTIDPNGSVTSYYFEWGPTTSYGNKGSAKSGGSGTQTESVEQTARNLTPGATYHYRLVASNASGTSDGADHTFTAGHPAPAATTGPATQVSSSGAILTGTVNPNGEDTSWYFQWGNLHSLSQQTAPGSFRALTSPQNVSWSLQGLLNAGTVYEYRLVASHPKGRKSYGDTQIFMTYPSVRPYGHVSQVTRPRHARHRPYLLTTTGTVGGPYWIPSQFACIGRVTIRFFRRHRQVRFMTAPIRPNCTFSRQTVFDHAPGGRTPTRLRVVVHFLSTPYLARSPGAVQYVTLG